MRQIEQPTKYKIAINIELSFPAGGDKGPKRNIGITTPGINSNNSGHPLIVSPSDRIMATTKNPIHVIGISTVVFWKRLSILKKSVDHSVIAMVLFFFMSRIFPVKLNFYA